MSEMSEMPTPIPLPVVRAAHERVRSFYVLRLPEDPKTHRWSCEDCGVPSDASTPEELGQQIVAHMAECG